MGFGVWPLALVSLVPLWRALEAVWDAPAWRAALAGLAFGAVAYAGGYPWLWRLVDAFLGGSVLLGVALWVPYGVWFSLRFVSHALLYRLARRRGAPVAVAAVPTFLVIEWLWPALFPVYAGVALVERTAWIQVADLGGPLLVSAVVLAANLAVFETWRWVRRERPRPTAVLAATGAALVLALGYGAVREHVLERELAHAPTLRLALVQGNLSVETKRGDPRRVHRRYLEQTRELLARDGHPDLVVWPETVQSRGLQRPLPLSGRFVREDIAVPLLFGAATVRVETGRRERYNSALLVGADGVIREAYDKNLLIPLAESIPFADAAPGLAALFPHAQRFAAATDTPPLTLGPWRISTPICYEAVRPDFVRRMVARANPHLLVSLANDAWFGDSQEPWLHDAVARLRAVEHRRALVRATNSGISSVVDPLGRVVARTHLLTREDLRAEVPLRDGQTLYGRLGDWPGGAAAGILALALVVTRRGRR